MERKRIRETPSHSSPGYSIEHVGYWSALLGALAMIASEVFGGPRIVIPDMSWLSFLMVPIAILGAYTVIFAIIERRRLNTLGHFEDIKRTDESR